MQPEPRGMRRAWDDSIREKREGIFVKNKLAKNLHGSQRPGLGGVGVGSVRTSDSSDWPYQLFPSIMSSNHPAYERLTKYLRTFFFLSFSKGGREKKHKFQRRHQAPQNEALTGREDPVGGGSVKC